MSPTGTRARGVTLSFRSVLRSFDDDEERAARAYVALHERITFVFERNRCYPERELADEVFDVMGRYIRRRRIDSLRNPGGLAYRIAQRICKRVRRQRWPLEFNPDRLSGTDDAVSLVPGEADAEGGEPSRSVCLKRCLSGLSRDDRRLILAYCSSPRGNVKQKVVRARLADSLGITPIRLNRRAFDIRRSLVACVEHCAKVPRTE